mgnify:CR=1 FL=1
MAFLLNQAKHLKAPLSWTTGGLEGSTAARHLAVDHAGVLRSTPTIKCAAVLDGCMAEQKQPSIKECTPPTYLSDQSI